MNPAHSAKVMWVEKGPMTVRKLIPEAPAAWSGFVSQVRVGV